MRRLLWLGTTLLLLVAGCAPAGQDHLAAVPSATLPAGPGEPALIYTAVLRRYLTSPQDNSNLDFATVFVLDHTDGGAADPMRATAATAGPASAPIAAADQREIAAALADIAPVRFVGSRDQVIVSADGCDVVRDHGVLLLLGPPMANEGSVRVGINGYVACLGATWLTYVVTHQPDGWQVTGTTGDFAVA